MPASKELLAKLKEYQQAASPDVCEAIFVKWASSFAAMSSTADALEVLSLSIQNESADASSKDKAPDAVFAAVMDYRMLLQNISKDLLVLKTAIQLRIPEIKEEDNLGVNVQIQVLEQLKAFIGRVNGGGGGSGKDENGGGGAAFPSVFFAREYLSSRSAIEEKLLGSEKDGPSKSQSLIKQLSIFDADTVARLSRSYRDVAQSQQFVISCFSLNYKKLFAPRVERVLH